MPRYEYRPLKPTAPAEKAFLEWIDQLDREFINRDADHRSDIVRDTLHQLYLDRPYKAPKSDAPLAQERKPLIWFWMMYDRSPVGLNHWLGYRVRAMLARHVFKHCGKNVKIFHGVEVSFGYNLTVEDNCTIHKYVLLDDRGEIIIHEGSSVSDYANVYSHAHDLNDGMIVDDQRTEIGPKARITYHATVLSGVTVGQHGMVGAMGVASKNVEPFHIVAGIPAKPVKIKSIAPEELRDKFKQK